MYWANTSSNGLVNRLIRRGSREIKMEMEKLLKGEVLQTRIMSRSYSVNWTAGQMLSGVFF